jgi:hypothetical protein
MSIDVFLTKKIERNGFASLGQEVDNKNHQGRKISTKPISYLIIPKHMSFIFDKV